MDMIYKTFKVQVKDFDENTGEVNTFIPLSSSEWDRDQEVIEPAAIKKHLAEFMKHPALISSHEYRNLTNLIGEWTKIRVTDLGVEGKPKYYIGQGNEQADWGFKLVTKGMGAYSYGFIPKVWEDGDGVKEPRRTYKEIELLEISQVIIPANREAIQNIRSKSADPIINEICDAVEKEIVTKPEETEEYIRIPVRECKITATIDISKDEGIKALYCGKEKEIATYLFAKDHGWTMAKARAWVKEHAKKYLIAETTTTENDDINIIVVKIPDIPQIYKGKKTSQEEIMDEIGYLHALITEGGGVSDKTREEAWILVEDILRLPGGDIPVNIVALIKPDVPKEETFTYSDISEAIRRMANKTEVK